MKKVILLLFLAVTAAGCKSNSYTVTGTAPDEHFSGEYAYLYVFGSRTELIDSALIGNGQFVFTGEAEEPALVRLQFQGDVSSARKDFVLENGRIRIRVEDDQTVVSGTPLNDRIVAQEQWGEAWRSRYQAVRAKYQQATSWADSLALDSEIEILRREFTEGETQFAVDNGDNVAGALKFMNLALSWPYEEQKKMIDAATDVFLSAPGMEQQLKRYYNLEKTSVGAPFLDFELPDASGETRKLSDFAGKGNVVLLDFWASWCGPCIADFPYLKEVYREFHPKGFEIVGVSLDSDESAWKEAIQKYDLDWQHLSDLKFWNSAAATLYGVDFVPSAFLIDGDGRFIERIVGSGGLRETLTKIYSE